MLPFLCVLVLCHVSYDTLFCASWYMMLHCVMDTKTVATKFCVSWTHCVIALCCLFCVSWFCVMNLCCLFCVSWFCVMYPMLPVLCVLVLCMYPMTHKTGNIVLCVLVLCHVSYAACFVCLGSVSCFLCCLFCVSWFCFKRQHRIMTQNHDTQSYVAIGFDTEPRHTGSVSCILGT